MTTLTSARFICPGCNSAVTANVEVPDVDWSTDRLSDSLSEDQTEVRCPMCSETFDAWAQNSPSHCTVELMEYPDVEVAVDDALFPEPGDEDEDWINLQPSTDPYEVLTTALTHLRSLQVQDGSLLDDRSELVRHMVFSHAVTAMEAYLGDTLQNHVSCSLESIGRLIDGHKALKEERPSLREIFDDGDIVRTRVMRALKAMLYHNLQKVSLTYKIATGVSILEDDNLRERLHKYMELRHDVVHRGGKSKSGERIELSADTVLLAIADIGSLAKRIELSIRAPLLNSPPT